MESHSVFRQISTLLVGTRTVEDLVGKLPPAMLRNYTLMKDSSSIQESSPEFPRAILFTPTANLIFAFNGNPNMTGFYTVDLMDYDAKKGEINMFLIQYDRTKSAPVLSGPNPRQCVACHGSPARYLFTDYRIWHGAFGEDDDKIFAHENEYAQQVDEWDIFKKFKLKAISSDPAYSRYHALYHSDEFPTWPYCPDISRRHLPEMPNLRLMMLMAANYSQTLLTQIKKNPLYAKIRYRILDAGLCQEGKYDGLTAAVLDFTKRRYPDWKMRKPMEPKDHGEQFLVPLLAPAWMPFSLYWGPDNLSLTWQEFQTGGANIPTLLLTAILFDSTAGPDRKLQEIETKIAAKDYDDGIYVPAGPFPDDLKAVLATPGVMVGEQMNKTFCRELSGLSQKEGKRFPLPKVVDASWPEPAILTTGPEILSQYDCIECHDRPGLEVGPYLPFSNPGEFKSMRFFIGPIVDDVQSKLNQFGPGQMPFARDPLLPQEKETLLKYLSQF